MKMYRKDWKTELHEELKKQFHPITYEKIKEMADTSMNILNRVVNEICTVYKEPAKRTIDGISDVEQESLDMLYASLDADQVLAEAHRYAKAATMSFIMPRAIPDENRIVLRLITPDNVYVETSSEDPTRMTLFAYASNVTVKGKTEQVWNCYTKDERWFCDRGGKVLDRSRLMRYFGERAEEMADTENKYEMIPVVAFPAAFQASEFWNENWNHDAYEGTLKIGMLWTNLSYLAKTQSFKQIVITADKISDETKNTILDPLMPLVMSSGGTATTLDLNTQLTQMYELIQGKIAGIANNYGISMSNFSLTTQPQSGFSLKIANQSLQDIRQYDIPLCQSVEKRLYKIIARIANVDDIASLPEDKEIRFNPGDVSWPEEWPTEKDRWMFEFENGISSPVDYLISRDPQKTREDAMAEIQKRQEEIKQLKPSVSPWSVLTGGAVNGNVGNDLAALAGDQAGA